MLARWPLGIAIDGADDTSSRIFFATGLPVPSGPELSKAVAAGEWTGSYSTLFPKLVDNEATAQRFCTVVEQSNLLNLHGMLNSQLGSVFIKVDMGAIARQEAMSKTIKDLNTKGKCVMRLDGARRVAETVNSAEVAASGDINLMGGALLVSYNFLTMGALYLPLISEVLWHRFVNGRSADFVELSGVSNKFCMDLCA